ncbi:hypothetical protein FOXB_14516 [Fusarium oxysporum f. sp. conglutinans Fo5176]|uniref:Uncharacterized protein n=1 Tax=Fusarium oxysporum (strain Fo5176) TaxID=660025 RepID=F9G784_FUSOF|nr:hypothetical protein FOXB_14516 [Fusarium oxysporum f. sp. conglutinans Fo5176]
MYPFHLSYRPISDEPLGASDVASLPSDIAYQCGSVEAAVGLQLTVIEDLCEAQLPVVVLEGLDEERATYHCNGEGTSWSSFDGRSAGMQSIAVVPLAVRPFEPLQKHKVLAAYLLAAVLIYQQGDQITFEAQQEVGGLLGVVNANESGSEIVGDEDYPSVEAQGYEHTVNRRNY